MKTSGGCPAAGRGLTLRAAVMVGAAVAGVLGASGTSYGWLGNFESADGYQSFLNMVQNYNAGEYGANSGYMAMSPTPIVPNSGRWTAVNGGFFTGSAVSYVTGHQNYDRQWVNNGTGSASNQGLVYTTGHEGWSGPALKYRYAFDAQDFGGASPTSTNLTEVKISFWNRGQLAGPELGGAVPDGYYGNEVSFGDGAGNTAFTLGLTQRASGDRITYWDGTNLFESALLPSSGFRYDRWDITFDLVNGLVSADLFKFETGTLINIVSGVPFQNGITGLTHMTLRSSPGVNNSKLAAIDDFTISAREVPAPGAAGLLVLGGMMAARRRRGLVV